MSTRDSTAPAEYRPIPNLPGYEVGSDGTVWTYKQAGTHKIGSAKRKLAQTRANHGYMVVRLSHQGKSITASVHRLVLTAFVGPCPAGMEACHENGVRRDNRIENLRWDTRKGNHADKLAHGTAQRGGNSGVALLTEGDVHEIRRRLANGETGRSIARDYGVDGTTVSAIRSGKNWWWLESPIMPPKSAWSGIEWRGERMSVREFARRIGVDNVTAGNRIRAGETADEIARRYGA